MNTGHFMGMMWCSRIRYRSFRHAIIFILLCLTLANCSPSSQSDQSKLKEIVAERMLSRFAKVDAPDAQQYLTTVAARLSIPITDRLPKVPPLFLIHSEQPVSALVGQQAIVLSPLLIKNLANEAELAFVIAHELSHLILGHAQEDQKVSSEKHREFELAADQYAVGIVAVAGYDPRAAIAAVARISWHTAENIDSHNYPNTQERISSLQKAIQDSGWQPPGTIDRRDFQKLRQVLSGIN